MLSRLAAHFSRYSLASLLVTLASIVSFPFLTRIFPVADYGMMSLIGVLVTATAAVGLFMPSSSVISPRWLMDE